MCFLGMGLLALSKQEIPEIPEKPEVSHFSWKVAEMTDRHNEMLESGTTCTDNLEKIQRHCDPDHSKALERIRKAYSE